MPILARRGGVRARSPVSWVPWTRAPGRFLRTRPRSTAPAPSAASAASERVHAIGRAICSARRSGISSARSGPRRAPSRFETSAARAGRRGVAWSAARSSSTASSPAHPDRQCRAHGALRAARQGEEAARPAWRLARHQAATQGCEIHRILRRDAPGRGPGGELAQRVPRDGDRAEARRDEPRVRRERDRREHRLEHLGALQRAPAARRELCTRDASGGGRAVDQRRPLQGRQRELEPREHALAALSWEQQRRAHSESPPSTTSAWPTM